MEKYCNLFRANFINILELARDATKSYNIKRGDVMKYDFPPVELIDDLDTSLDAYSISSDYFRLSCIPPLSRIEKVIQYYSKNIDEFDENSRCYKRKHVDNRRPSEHFTHSFLKRTLTSSRIGGKVVFREYTNNSP